MDELVDHVRNGRWGEALAIYPGPKAVADDGRLEPLEAAALLALDDARRAGRRAWLVDKTDEAAWEAAGAQQQGGQFRLVAALRISGSRTWGILDLVRCGMAFAGRHHADRVRAVELALELHGGAGSALYAFGCTATIQDEGHRQSLLAEVAARLAQVGDADEQARLADLLGIARHAPAGGELAGHNDLHRS